MHSNWQNYMVYVSSGFWGGENIYKLLSVVTNQSLKGFNAATQLPDSNNQERIKIFFSLNHSPSSDLFGNYVNVHVFNPHFCQSLCIIKLVMASVMDPVKPRAKLRNPAGCWSCMRSDRCVWSGRCDHIT